MISFHGQPGIDPILLAFGVITHVRVAHGRQFTGGLFRSVSSGAGAVHDNLRMFVWQTLRCQFADLRWRQVDCAWQVRLVIHKWRQRLDQRKSVAPVNLGL
jgi:hypothetical protein